MKKLALVLAVALLFTAVAQASVVTVAPTTDNSGWNFYPYTWGEWTAYKVTMNDTSYIFKKFQPVDLSGTVTSAYLTIPIGGGYGDNDGVAAGGSFLDIYNLTADWNSTTPHSPVVGSMIAVADSANYSGSPMTLTVDVTAAVQAWQTSGIQPGFAFESRLPGGGLQNWTNDFNEVPAGTTLTVVTEVPEPATMCLLGLGSLAMLRRRK